MDTEQQTENHVVDKEPWPAEGIKANSRIADYEWGYLLRYSNGQFKFDLSARPSDKEIQERWYVYLVN